jgi:GDP/UDP-N,N'-diacetylbacillosamine 2-epimerase (hydrolysing)
MKIALISCGRSDYSIYLPLMKKFRDDSYFNLDVIAFGTHVSRFYDKTVNQFYNDGFHVAHEVESLILGDSPEAIGTAMGLTTLKFSAIWAKENYDIIVVLGDRFEMFSAIAASVPFNIPVAHLHGGETTLGAIDDKFRHCITSMSTYHFVTTENHKKRVIDIIGSSKNVFSVGAPALDNLHDLNLLSKEEFYKTWDIDMSVPTVLTTFHPETVALDKNEAYIKELIKVIDQIDKQFVITLPNNDTMATMIREYIIDFAKDNPQKCKVVEVLGAVGYYSCMKHADFLLGNTSSGIIEAASFAKYVINVGDRQKGRDAGRNVIHVPVDADQILKAVMEVEKLPTLNGENIYGNGTATSQIIQILKKKNIQ